MTPGHRNQFRTGLSDTSAAARLGPGTPVRNAIHHRAGLSARSDRCPSAALHGHLVGAAPEQVAAYCWLQLFVWGATVFTVKQHWTSEQTTRGRSGRASDERRNSYGQAPLK